MHKKHEKDFRNIKNGKIEKLMLAVHVEIGKYTMDHKQVLLKQASNKQELTNRENILIYQKTKIA